MKLTLRGFFICLFGRSGSQVWVEASRNFLQQKIVKCLVAPSCPALCNPMDYTVHQILQARILKWVAVPFSRESSQPRDQILVFCIAGGLFNSWAQGKPEWVVSPFSTLLEWVVYPFSIGSSWPRNNRIRVSCIAGGFFINWVIGE